METLLEEIRNLVPVGQVQDERTENEMIRIWMAIIKLAEAIDNLNKKE